MINVNHVHDDLDLDMRLVSELNFGEWKEHLPKYKFQHICGRTRNEFTNWIICLI